jgi:hypothetical protein
MASIKAIPTPMKSNHFTKTAKAFLAISLLALCVGQVAAQVDLVSNQQPANNAQGRVHATIPGESIGGPGESF